MQTYCSPLCKYLIFSIAIYLAYTKLLDLNIDNQKIISLVGISVFVYFLLENFTYSPIMVPIVAEVTNKKIESNTENYSNVDYNRVHYDELIRQSNPTVPKTPNVPPHLNYVDPAFPTHKITYKTDGTLRQPNFDSYNQAQKYPQNMPQIGSVLSRKSGLTGVYPEANDYPDYNQNMNYAQHDQDLNYFPGNYPIGGNPPRPDLRLKQGSMSSDNGEFPAMDLPYSN